MFKMTIAITELKESNKNKKLHLDGVTNIHANGGPIKIKGSETVISKQR